MIEDKIRFTFMPESTERSPLGELLLSLVAAEIYESASVQQAEGFFETVGGRLAALASMDDVHDLAVLESRANQLWRLLGWGDARMVMQDGGVQIRHFGLPQGLDGDFEGHWPNVLRALLRGAYDRWFRALGSGNSLHTRVVHVSEEEVEFYHGV